MPDFFGRATVVLGQHATLHGILQALRDWCSEGTPSSKLHSPAGLLDDLVSQLETHFAAEESDAYFGTLRGSFPDAEAAIEQLTMEHAAFLDVARSLRVQARELVLPAKLAASLAELLDALGHHERTESLLLRQYFREGQD
jgi:hemerythrin